MPPSRLQLGIIGAGAATRNLHLPALHSLQDRIAIRGIFDVDEHSARMLLGKIQGCRQFSSVDALLLSGDIGAVAVLTPPSTHWDLALAAIHRKKHVFVEKPLSVDAEQGRALAEAARDARVCAAVGHNLRFHRFVTKARQILSSGALGDLLAIHTMWNSLPGGRSAWQRDRSVGGGVLFDLGVHHFDLAHYLTGATFEQLSAVTRSVGADDLAASVSGRMSNGALFSASWSKMGGESNFVRIAGTRATLEFSLYRPNSWRLTPVGLAGLAAYVDEALQYSSQAPDVVHAMRTGGDMAASYRAEWIDFADAIARGRAPLASFDAVLPSIEACCTVASSVQALPGAEPVTEQAAAGADEPALSVILSVKGKWDLARRTVRHLRAQTVRDRIELILVSVSDASLTVPDAELTGFCNVQVLQVRTDASVAQANAAGVRAASSRLVAFAEDHCFPEPDWADALIKAHAQGHAAVGPEIANANPGSVVSWCDYLLGYGPWMSPCTAGQVPFLPGHNSSYKRDVLLGYGDRLEAMLESETVLHFDLVRQGHTLYLEPSARAAHLNFAQWGVWLPVQYHCGRVFAGSRASSWGMGRKLFYGAASPLIPFVRAARSCAELWKPNRPRHRMAGILPALLVGLVIDGFGQMLGYLAGPADSVARLADYEYDRLRFVRPADRRALDELDGQLQA